MCLKKDVINRRFFKILLTLLLIAGLVAYSLLFLTKSTKADSLVGFNEGSGTSLHAATGGVTGTITGALWRPESECLTGSCLYFDGTGDYISFGDESTYDFAAATNWSIELWFKTGPISSGTRTILTKYNSATSTDGGYKIYMSSDGKLNFGIDDDQTSFPEDIATSQGRLDDNQWHFLSATKSGTTDITMYIDAQRVAQDASLSSNGTLVNTDSFYLGSDNGSTNGWMGYLDELKITVASARTADQIKSDYQKTTTTHGVAARFGPDTSVLNNGLVGYWKMDESSGDPVDSTGNGNLLSNGGTTTFVSGKYLRGSEFVPASSQYFYVPAVKNYYFDGSDAAASDPGGVWSNPNFAFNGDLTSFSNTSTFGDENTNYLMAEGTNAPDTGGTISQVRARLYAGVDDNQGSGMTAKIYSDGLLENLATIENFELPAAWGSYYTLNTPTGGWTWPKIQALEVKAFVPNVGQTLISADVYKLELEVSTPADPIRAIKSLSFWVNPDNTTNYYCSLTSGAYITSTSGVISATGFTNPKIYVNGISSNTIVADSWQHVVVTFDSIDADQFYIGRQGSNYFDGTMDEVRLYSRTLSDTDVLNLYNWAPDPIAYFPMDENTNSTTIQDLSLNGNSGATSGLNRSSWVPGKLGSAVRFLGTANQSITVNDSSSLSLTGDFTISAWINPTTLTASTRYPLISKNTNLTTRSYEMSLYGDEIRVYIGSGSNYVTTDASNLVVGNWYYITAKYSASAQTVTIYINGIPQTATTTGTIPNSISDLSNSLSLGTTTGSEGTNNYQVGTSADDANMTGIANDLGRNVTTSGPVSITNTLFSPGSHGSNNEYSAGARFAGITLPRFPIITSARFTLTPAATKNVAPNIINYHLSGQSADNPGSFTTSNGDLNTTARPRTTADCGIWTQASVVINSPASNIVTNCIQEIVSRPGWSSGNSIIILVDTHANTTLSQFQDYFTYDNTPSKAPKLDITYSSIDPYDGLLDDVKIFNYARTPGQITQDMNAGHPAPGSPVGSAALHFKFDSGYGDIAQNSGNLGTALNGDLGGISYTCPTGGGCPAWVNTGKYDKALSFDGGDWLETPNNAVFNASAFTLSAWLYRTGAVNGSNGAGVAGRWNTNEGAFIWIDTSNIIEFPVGSSPHLSSGVTADLNTWYHVVGTFDGTTSTIYVNGQKKASKADSTTFSSITQGFEVGRYASVANTNFTGKIDDVKFYNSALTEDHVKLEYNQGKTEVLGALSTTSTGLSDNSSDRSYCVPGDTGTCTTPVAEFKLDENTGTTANDTSGSAGSATLFNGAAFTSGKIGSAVSFDGVNDLIELGDNNNIDLGATDDFTISLWVNRTKNTPIETDVYSKKLGIGAADSGVALVTWGSGFGGNTCLYVSDGTNQSELCTFDDTTISLNVWQYIAVSFNHTTRTGKIYLDGKDSTYTPYTVTPGSLGSAANTRCARIGGLAYGSTCDGTLNGTKQFAGKVDQVRIFKAALTDAQVAWDYNRGGPVAWYKFDETSWNNNCSTSTVFDSSGNSLNGVSCPNTTGQTTPEAGKIGNAMHFDDVNDYVSVADNSNLDLTGGLSVSAWVNTDANEADNVILSKGTSYEVGINADGDVYWDGVGAQVDDASAKVQSGAWHHIVVTDDDTTVTFYVDGVKTGSTAAGVDTDNATAMYLGYDGTNYFDGLLDDVKVFSYPLNSTQVKTLYNQNSAVKF